VTRHHRTRILSMESPDLDRCPICQHDSIECDWIPEYGQFQVRCPQCAVFTITASLAAQFGRSLSHDDRVWLKRLSTYLRNAGDDDEREVTEVSWRRLAAEG